jgi:hypothetical protein
MVWKTADTLMQPFIEKMNPNHSDFIKSFLHLRVHGATSTYDQQILEIQNQLIDNEYETYVSNFLAFAEAKIKRQ